MRGAAVRTLALTNGIFSEDLIRGKWGFICTPSRSTALKERNDCLSFSPSPSLFSSRLTHSSSITATHRKGYRRTVYVAALGRCFTIWMCRGAQAHIHVDTSHALWLMDIAISDDREVISLSETSIRFKHFHNFICSRLMYPYRTRSTSQDHSKSILFSSESEEWESRIITTNAT